MEQGRFFLDKFSTVYILDSFEYANSVEILKIRVDDIRDAAKLLTGSEPVGEYPSLAEVQESGECSFLAPLALELTVTREYDLIRVHGRVATRVRLGCSRCLNDYQMAIDSPFTIFYTRSSGMPLDEEVELAEEDLISTTYTGDEIDLAPEIAEQVLLEIPFKPLCREECRGLCSVCGADLNAGDCRCDRRDINLKFSALKDFKVNK